MAPELTCILCGYRGIHVLWGLIRWAQPEDGDPYGYGPRCKDHEACRRRVHHNGDDWPVAEPLADEVRS